MAIMDIIVPVALVFLAIAMVFVFIAKKRMDRNEPVWGWQRKQYLEEQKIDSTSGAGPQMTTRERKQQAKEERSQESIRELLEIKDINLGVIEREKNEFVMVLETDFVNFDLLQAGERTAILEGYQQLYNIANFPMQMLVQAVRQDFSKDRLRFEENLSRCNIQAARYNQDVIRHIEDVTENDFRITISVYYLVKYHYEPSKVAKLTKEQRVKHIQDNVLSRANIVRGALRRARIDAQVLSSLEAAEVLKRALNRDRMLLHPIESVELNEKLSDVVTLDYATLPEFENLVTDVEEAIKLVAV